MTLRVHVAGMRTGTDRAANAAAAVDLVEHAAADGAGLLVLPEYAAAFDPHGVGREHAEPLDGPFVRALEAAAARTGVHVIAGTLTPGEADGRAANVVVVVAPTGVVAAYRKVHLYDAFGHRESDRLEPGPADAAPVVVDVAGLRVGVMTCYDLRFPESARRLVDSGATVLAVPAAWAAGEHKAEHWGTLLRARAIESTAYVLGSVQTGPGVTGDPTVVDPDGVVISAGPGVAGGGEQAVVVAELDPARVVATRERNPSLANRRYGVVPLPPRVPQD